MIFDASAIPLELRDRPQWLVWRFEKNPKKPEGKPLKVPYYVKTRKRRLGEQGSESDRAKLVTLDAALALIASDAAAPRPFGFTGIGFAFLPGDGLIGIDIDGCIDQETGEIAETADGIIHECASYTEYSPSRTGVHIIVAGETETFKSNDIGLEVFCGSQFFTFTAQPYAGMPASITSIGDVTLGKMRDLVKGARRKAASASTSTAGSPRAFTQLSDMDERRKARSALAVIPPDDYHVWIKVGMALRNRFGDQGFDLWNEWSRDSAKYAGSDECMEKWRSFDDVKATIATVYGIAQDYGWRIPLRPREEKPIARPAAATPPAPQNEDAPAVDQAETNGAAPVDDGSPLDSSPSPQKEKPRLRLVEGPDLPGGEPPVDGAAMSGKGDAEAKGKGGGRKKTERPQSFFDSVERLLENFVLLYGTNTAWDTVNRMQIKITDLRYAYGSEAVKWWLNNPGRKMINYDRLVFDPTCKCDLKTHVNLYEGRPVEPKKGTFTKISELLLHLCNGDEEVWYWILCWIAYPLRNPGAKMTTSIVMHGDEGSGKNLFWEEIVCALYGKYGGVIGNAQIETQYNEWVSQKLFFVCDEVVTRTEMKQLKGKLKALISGKRMNVNPKHLPERSEANHMNFVFLSNELQPLALDQSDRRYLVAWTPPKQPLEYYKEVADEMANGGIEAFLHFLLYDLDMGDFNEHSKPLDTEAKQDLITLSLDAPERFYREWSNKALPLPVICCGAMQLYWAFLRWCHLNGERFPQTHVLFARKIKRYAGDKLKTRMVTYELGEDVKQRTVYLIGDPPEGKTQSEWVEECSKLFDKYLKKYRNVYDQSELPSEE